METSLWLVENYRVCIQLISGMEKEINVGSCMENPKAKSGDTNEVNMLMLLMLFLNIMKVLSHNSTMRI